jgi:pyridoxine kinase
MKRILSIQSHVAYGYVGNRAAVFPLQRLGCDVIAINTVQFSNHTGYGAWRGDIFSSNHVKEVLLGLEERDAFAKLDAVLSGYLGDAALGALILETVEQQRIKNPALIYCCDPVIGDVDRGIFVRPGIPEFFLEKAVPLADIITPNHFELEYLIGSSAKTLDEILAGCAMLRKRGPKCVLVTSVHHQETPEDCIEVIVDTEAGTWRVVADKFPFNPAPNGAGDAIAAIFLAHYLENQQPEEALVQATSALTAIFRKTYELKQRELALIQAQDEIVHPAKVYQAERIR